MKEIQLTRGQVALVDDADYERLMRWKWSALAKQPDGFYARRYLETIDGVEKSITMHCAIMGMTWVDHKDGNGLNNQRSNLRPATQRQQQYNKRLLSTNKSGFNGVSWDKNAGKWRVRLRTGDDGRKVHIGLFDDINQAAAASDEARKRYHGEFARPNSGDGKGHCFKFGATPKP